LALLYTNTNNYNNRRNVHYCFVATKSHDIISKIKGGKIGWSELETESDFKNYLFTNTPLKRNDKVISYSTINDLGDYDIPNITSNLMEWNLGSSHDSDSLLSLSCLNEKYFSCMTDFWGIMTHYWSNNDDSFICSNNIFLVSSLIGRAISENALYEYLFFLAPRRDNTWFENIKCLLPGQKIIFNFDENSVKLSKSTDFSVLFKSQDKDLIGAVEDFFLKIKNINKPYQKNYISLSAGSDSRTVLACLLHYSFIPQAISFGRDDMLESEKIRKMTDELKIPWNFVDLRGFEKDFNELFIKGTYIGNGLLNPYRTHYLVFYDNIKRNNNLFEGILGSEFIKGEICIDAMISKLHSDVISKGITIDDAVEKHLHELSDTFKESMTSYIKSNYGTELTDVNTKNGFKDYQMFSLGFVPSKIFAPLMMYLLNKDINPYYPFLSPKILKSVFSNGYGLSSNISLREDFNGPIRCLEAEAKIVKSMDENIFNSLLDRNITYKDVLISHNVAKMKKKYRIIENILKNRKKLQRGQIDNSKISELIGNIVDPNYLNIISSKDIPITNDLIKKAITNLSFIQKIESNHYYQ
jgi:hypothetical protein